MTTAAPVVKAPALDDASPGLRVEGGPVPWRAGDLARLLAGLGLGGAALLVAWYGASGTTKYNEQLLWVVVGIAAVIVQGLGAAGWLLNGHRSVRARQRRLEGVLRWAHDSAEPAELVATASTPAPRTLVTGAGMSRYHRSDCLLVEGKPVTPATAATAGLEPCGVCAP